MTDTNPLTQDHTPVSESNQSGPGQADQGLSYWRIAVWVAIGAIIASALVCVIWVILGDSGSGIIPRAFLTVVLLAGFSGVALYDASAAGRRRQWLSLLSLAGWVIILVLAMVKIWSPMQWYSPDNGVLRFFELVGIVLVIRLAILFVQLFTKLLVNPADRFARIDGSITIGLVGLLAVLLLVPLVFTGFIYHDVYYRLVVGIAILATVGTVLVPLFRLLNGGPAAGVTAGTVSLTAEGYPAQGQQLRGQSAQGGYVSGTDRSRQQTSHLPSSIPTQYGWPLFVDGVTPLPVLANGSPDLDAFHTGRLSAGARIMTTAEWDVLRDNAAAAQRPASGAVAGSAAEPAPVEGGQADVQPEPVAEVPVSEAPVTESPAAESPAAEAAGGEAPDQGEASTR
ncbi:MAG: hypothetical protein ACTJHU_05025, partial [Mycetocola sp.]